MKQREQTESYELADKKTKMNTHVDHVPMASCLVQTFQNQPNKKPFVVLFDSGSSHSWWNGKSLPKGCVPSRAAPIASSTLAGQMTSGQQVRLEGITFPEFFSKRTYGQMEAHVFHTDCRYDAITRCTPRAWLYSGLQGQENELG